jgi:copper chaperone CopZ
VGGAILFALGIDYLLPREWFVSELVMQGDCCHEEIGLFNIISAVVLILLLINALFLHRHHNHEEEFMEETEATCFMVEGMNCSHCAANVEKAIRSVEGVENVSVFLSEKQALVSGNYDEYAVREAVENIGYKIK